VILLNTTPNEGAVRAGDWKLIVNEGQGRQARRRGESSVQLFDLRNDPYEKSNLAKERPEKVEELRQALSKFVAEAIPPKAGPMPKSFAAPEVWGEAGG
jgi:arylsulfatase A-like enzyme